MPKLKKSWVVAAIGAFILATFVFNDSLRLTISRHRMISDAQSELRRISIQIAAYREKINHVKTVPESHELLVRRELGYMRPGEKEIRFVKEEK